MSIEARSKIMPASPTKGGVWIRRLAPALLIVAGMALVFITGCHRYLSIDQLMVHRADLADFVATHHATAIVAFIGIYVLTVTLSIPSATFLTICSGILFGGLVGALASIIGATIGATIIFLIA